jgi:hypothetical protein
LRSQRKRLELIIHSSDTVKGPTRFTSDGAVLICALVNGRVFSVVAIREAHMKTEIFVSAGESVTEQ